MRASDVMTSPVITVQKRTPVIAAAALLVAHGFTAAPVVDEHGGLVGIVTEADLVADRIIPEDRPPTAVSDHSPGTTVGEVMTRAPLVVSPDSDVAELARLMHRAGTHSLPVMSDGDLVGIVSRRDILRVIARGETTGEQVRRRRDLAGAPS